jgi:hypothetical protein
MNSKNWKHVSLLFSEIHLLPWHHPTLLTQLLYTDSPLPYSILHSPHSLLVQPSTDMLQWRGNSDVSWDKRVILG